MNTLHLVSISSVLLTLVVRADHLVLVAGSGAKEDDAPAIETKLTAPFDRSVMPRHHFRIQALDGRRHHIVTVRASDPQRCRRRGGP